MDPSWAEREYNPRLAVLDAAAITVRWPERAAATRARRPPTEIRYGDRPREAVDVFRPAGPSRGAVLFIHGGYWRAFSKGDFSWVADRFLDDGLSVAVLGYPLCPEVRLRDIAEAARRAFVTLHRQVLSAPERERLVVTGHSAGGYLSALHLATDWQMFGLPESPLIGAVPISGVFELAPLIRTSMNEAIRLDLAEADRLSITGQPHARAKLTLAVGGNESAEFHRQSEALAERWEELGPDLIDVPGRNHFDVIDGLVDPASALYRAIIGMIEAPRR